MSERIDTFLPEEWAYLENHLQVTSNKSQDEILSIHSYELLNQSSCANYIKKLMDLEQTNSSLFATSIFSKRYACMLIHSGLYVMSNFEKGINLHIENCYIESNYEDSGWLPNIRYDSIKVTNAPTEDRPIWRDEVLRSLFANHLTPLWKSISSVANIPMPILWENTAVYIFTLYEKRLVENKTVTEKVRIEDDFQYIMEKASGELFGLRKNPLTTFFYSKVIKSTEGNPIRLRKTCCYYYELNKSRGYCKSCPKICSIP